MRRRSPRARRPRARNRGRVAVGMNVKKIDPSFRAAHARAFGARRHRAATRIPRGAGNVRSRLVADDSLAERTRDERDE
jgi:hypothetical protein